jgi:indolepyruvate ferredoxin oxidoreductase alpha subunit
MSERLLLSGNEAIARGAFEAGVSVAAGYPGTPSTEILENLTRYEGVYCQWSANEKVALEVASGASYAGARSLVTMKHVGLNVAADPFFTLSYTGVGSGLVVISADDPQLYSSQNEQDNRHYARAAKVPMLEPSDSQEAKELTLMAFSMSERFDTPVLLRSTTRLSHSRTPVTPGPAAEIRKGKRPEKDPSKMVMIPAYGLKRHVLVEERLKALKDYSEEFAGNRIIGGGERRGFVSSGVAYQYAREAFPNDSHLKLALTHPFPADLVRKFASQVEELYVIEELDPFMEEQIKALGLPVTGKAILPRVGEYNPGILTRAIDSQETDNRAVQEGIDVPARPPVLCPGCPHRGIFHTLGQRRYFVTGDIGCYTLATLPPLSALDTCLCMGASIGQALGIEKAMDDPSERVAAVIGDSTFFHSGLTPLLDIVHNHGRTTVIVLDNHTTAMTGLQDHPGTGKSLGGKTSAPVDISRVAEAIGIDRVAVTNAFDLKSIISTLEEAEEGSGSCLIVNRGSCSLLSREPGRPLEVNDGLCSGCRSCLAVACPALGWDRDRMNARGQAGTAVIDPHLCKGCGVCLQVCRFSAIGEMDGG